MDCDAKEIGVVAVTAEQAGKEARAGDDIPAHLPDNFLGYSQKEQQRIESDTAKDDPKYEEFYCCKCWNFYY